MTLTTEVSFSFPRLCRFSNPTKWSMEMMICLLQELDYVPLMYGRPSRITSIVLWGASTAGTLHISSFRTSCVQKVHDSIRSIDQQLDGYIAAKSPPATVVIHQDASQHDHPWEKKEGKTKLLKDPLDDATVHDKDRDGFKLLQLPRLDGFKEPRKMK